MPRVTWQSLNRRVLQCTACPRLIKHCKDVAIRKRRAYQDEEYWGGPVSNFGDPNAKLLVVGLAPGAHGANRTGRMFTGDRSGDWLYRALHKAGFANQPESTHRDDGLTLKRCAITNACRCAPPDNKPTKQEVAACQPFLYQTIQCLPVVVFLALGQLAWKVILDYAFELELLEGKRPRFSHGAEVELATRQVLLGSYHPSQQNTFTGRLTEPMLDDVMTRAKKLIRRRL